MCDTSKTWSTHLENKCSYCAEGQGTKTRKLFVKWKLCSIFWWCHHMSHELQILCFCSVYITPKNNQIRNSPHVFIHATLQCNKMSVMSQMVRLRWGTANVHAHHLYLTKCISVSWSSWDISADDTFRRSHFSSSLQLEEIMLSSLFKWHSSASLTGICALLHIQQP